MKAPPQARRRAWPPANWGRARSVELLLLLGALAWQPSLGAPASPPAWCQMQDPPSSFRSSVQVANDTALLAALQNPTVDGIQLTKDIQLGPDWQAAAAAPIVLQRNVTIYSPKQVTLDLSTVVHAVYLGSAVMLTFSGLLVRQESSASLDPGLMWISGAAAGAQVYFSGVRLEEDCCVSPGLWNRYASDFNLSTSVYSIDTTFVCDKVNNCFEQQATFVQLCSAAGSLSENGHVRQYNVGWSHTVLLCTDSAADSCMANNSAQYCIAQCVNTGRPPSPPIGPGAPPVPQSEVHSAADVQTIVLATVVPAGVVAVLSIIGFLVWRQRRLRSGISTGDLHDKHGDGFCGLFGPCMPLVDLEGQGHEPPGGHRPDARESAVKPPGGSRVALSHADQQDLEQQGSPTMSLALAAGGSPSQASHGEPQSEQLRRASLQLHQRTGQGGSMQPRLATAGENSVLHDSGQPPICGAGFNAAAAVASLAASREQGDVGGDVELVDLQKRVQQLAEERLILEDEKLVLGKPIGRGAFGMVFRGLWRNLDVAVKTMLFSQNDGARQENAIVEAALASSVVHPNVVSVYHFDMKPISVKPSRAGGGESLQIEHEEGQTDWKMYIVQELCQTSLVETLDSWVFHDQATGMPRMDLILAVLLDVASGCAHIHSKNIIWGDLKPGNVLLKMDASKPHGVIAKITDFGMSTTIDPNLSHISNYNKGTPFYVAPEILLSHQATKTSDVFSFGILIQQMITRSTPYQRNESGGVEVNKQFWRPTPGCPPALADLRRRCLDQTPKNRPSFDEIVKCLQEVYDSYLACMAPSAGGVSATEAGGAGRDLAACGTGTAEPCSDRSPAHAGQPASSAAQWDLRPGLAQAAATSTSHAAHDPGQATGLVSHSVPTRSTSAFINHEAAFGLSSLQSQSPLFANWPMSDGALQGMQLLDPQLPTQGQQHSGQQQLAHHHGSRHGPDGQPGNSGATPHDKSLDPSNHAPARDLFPNWSTQF